MITLTFRNLWSHKRRLVATVLAVALGVAFLSGTLVLGDTMRGTFKTLFEQSNAGTDVVIQTRSIETGTHTERGQVDEALVARVRDVAGVADVAPVVEGYGRIIGRDGKPVGGMGPPTVAGSWAPDPFNPYRLVDGRAPQADDEVVLNRGAATAAGLQVGDTATVETPSPVPVRVVGIATFGDADSAGGLTYAGFTLAGAQRHVLGRTGQVTSVVAAAEPGVGQLGLRDRLAPLAPAGTEVLTGAELTARQQQGINEDFLDFLTVFLTVFAGVAVAVAAFGISNTFTILVTQRRRESALVRSLGATRRQVLAATIVEALVVGLVASALGVIAGVGLAVVLKAAFAGLGMTVPAIGLVVQPYVLAVGLAVGVLVTLAAAVLPARRAARVAPLEALRDAAGEPVGVGRWRVGLGLVALVAGLAVTVAGSRAAALGPTAAGAALTIVAAVVLGPVVARWLGPWSARRCGWVGA
ncbi:MAG: ABC transporter permease [Acidimicrobiales bacterium]